VQVGSEPGALQELPGDHDKRPWRIYLLVWRGPETALYRLGWRGLGGGFAEGE